MYSNGLHASTLSLTAWGVGAGYVSGQVGALLFPDWSPIKQIILLFTAALLAAVATVWLLRIIDRGQGACCRCLYAMLFALAMATGWIADEPQRQLQRRLKTTSESLAVFTGRLDREHNSWLVDVRGPESISTTVRLQIPGALAEERMHPQDQVVVAGRVLPVSLPSNPGSFNQVNWMIQHGWAHTLEVQRLRIDHIRQRDQRGRIRDALHERLVRLFPRDDVLALVAAMILADRSLISKDMERSFRRSGLMHLLAVSGLHFGCILLLVWLLVGAFVRRLPLPHRTRLWVTSALVVCFAAAFASLAGWSPSVVRAFMMLTTGLVCRSVGRRGWIERSLMISALLVTILYPLLWQSVGTQLSFAAVFGIAMAMRMQRSGTHSNPVLSTFVGALRVSTAAFMGTLPVLLWHMGWVPVVALLISPPAVTLTSAALLLALVALLLPMGGAVVATVSTLLYRIIIFMADWAADLGLPYLGGTTMIDMGAACALLIALAVLTHVRMRTYHRTLLTFVLVSGVILAAFRPASVQLTLLDVGQGDALILTHDGAWISADHNPLVVDTGPGNRSGNVVADALGKQGVEKASVLLTHADLDHVGGLQRLSERITIRWLYTPWPSVSDSTMNMRLERGMSLKLDVPVRGYVLHPPRPGRDNHHSLVVLLVFGQNGVLLTGDIDQAAEKQIVRDFGPLFDTLQYRVLKVAHHGSATSTGPALLERFRPDVALISAGTDNQFSHPDPAVVRRLDETGTIVLETSEHGAISLRAPGGTIALRSHGKGKWRRIPVQP